MATELWYPWAAPLLGESPNRPTGAPETGPFDACASCARIEERCSCDHRDVRRYSGVVESDSVPTFAPAQQRALNRPPRGSRLSVEVEVELTETGWRVIARRFGTPRPYIATITACHCRDSSRFPVTVCLKRGCTKTFGRDHHCHRGRGQSRTKHRENVEVFVAALAKTYAGYVSVPAVPPHWLADVIEPAASEVPITIALRVSASVRSWRSAPSARSRSRTACHGVSWTLSSS